MKQCRRSARSFGNLVGLLMLIFGWAFIAAGLPSWLFALVVGGGAAWTIVAVRRAVPGLSVLVRGFFRR